jgi:hypothetical protein
VTFPSPRNSTPLSHVQALALIDCNEELSKRYAIGKCVSAGGVRILSRIYRRRWGLNLDDGKDDGKEVVDAS